MGLKKGSVRLEEYNDNWVNLYELEKQNLEKLLDNIYLSIEHIGSTAIKGLKAKPIIDIAVGVKKLTDFERVKNHFKDYPYSYKFGYDNDEVLIRRHQEDLTTHLIHLMEIESDRYKNTIIFRNYLNSHKNDLKKYQKLKENLAIKYADNRPMYTSSKNEFIQSILKKAKKDS